MKTLLLALTLIGCVSTSDTTSTSDDSVSAIPEDTYLWMVGHWVCGSHNGYHTAQPAFKNHAVVASYDFSVVSSTDTETVVHESYHDTPTNHDTLEPDYAFEADITIDRTAPATSRGLVAGIAGEYSDGSVFAGRGRVNKRHSGFLGSYSFQGEITMAADKLTRDWDLVNFTNDPSPDPSAFGSFGENFYIGQDGLFEELYLATDCVKE